MNDPSSFERFLLQEFRWPRSGDRAFVTSLDRRSNALIAVSARDRTVMMITGYKKAADLMVTQAMTDRFDRDALVYPIIFNYRQFVELSLKYLIATYGPSVAIEPNWKSHRLEDLWRTFSRLLLAYPSKDPDHTDPAVEKIIAEFAKVDPASFSYRYPVDTSGHPIPIAHNELDVTVLADVMSALNGYFDGCDGYFDSLQTADS